MIKTIRDGVLIIIAVSLIISLSKNIFSYKDKLAFYHDYRKEYEGEMITNKKLKSDLKKSDDYYYVEKRIRENLNYLQASETAFIIPKIVVSPTPTPVVPKSPAEQWGELIW